MRLLILGGNRFIGAELVKRAVEQGHDVTVLSLDKPPIEGTRWLKANRDSSLPRLFAKLVFDTVIDNIAFRGQHVTSLLDALRDKVNRYVLTSSVDIYRNQEAKYCDERKDERLKPFLHSDTVPLWEAYLRGKRACEIALRASVYFEKVVVRPAVVIGARDNLNCPPEGLISRSLFFPLRIADGGPILLRHTDTRLHQLAYVSDVAQAMLLAATHRLAAGQILNVVGDEVWTNESLVYSLSGSVGKKTDVLRVNNSQLEIAGLAHYQTPYFRSRIHSWSLFSNQRLKALGWNPTPVNEWGRTLFCSTKAAIKSIAEQRQRELGLGRQLLGRVSVSLTSCVEGKYHKAEQAISSIGIGTHPGSESLYDDRRYLVAIRRAVQGGINVIDTAINYRNMRSEQVVGKAIKSLVVEGTDRSSLCVVSKGGFIPSSLLTCGLLTGPEIKRMHSITAPYIAVSLRESIRNTGLECIDMYLLHNPEISLEALGEGGFYENLIRTFAMLEQKVRDGSIGIYGIATWDGLRTPIGHNRHIDLDRVIRCSELAAGGSSHFRAIELPFNDKAQEAATVRSQKLDNRLASTLDLAAARGLLVLTSRSMMSGAGDLSKSLRFVRGYPQVSCALVGMRQLEHVNQALAIMGLDRAHRGRKQESKIDQRDNRFADRISVQTGFGPGDRHRARVLAQQPGLTDKNPASGGNSEFCIDDKLVRLIRFAKDGAFSLSTAALILAAEQRGIRWIRINPHNLVQLVHGRCQKFINGTITSETSGVAVRWAADKRATNRLLGALGLPVPNQVVVHNTYEAVSCAGKIGYPVVVKPLDSCQGLGVSVGLTTPEEVQIAFEMARRFSNMVLIETHIFGCDHRMLVINNELVAVAKRIPGHVTGDGTRTVAELVREANKDPRRGRGHENVLTLLQLDSEAERVLAKSGYGPGTIPPSGETVYLRGTANLSSGGIAIDVTAGVHPENREMAVCSILAIGLDVGGVDFITSDISKPFHRTGGAICEVNASPGLRMHLAPNVGTRRDVAGPIIDMLFPAGTPNTIRKIPNRGQ